MARIVKITKTTTMSGEDIALLDDERIISVTPHSDPAGEWLSVYVERVACTSSCD
jgi:hypothetical protein